MKKITILTLLAIVLLFFGTSSIGFAQTASDPFTGKWWISDARVRGTVNKDDIGCSVTIRYDDPYYSVSGLDDRCDRIGFSRQGNRLEGDYLANFEYLVKHYATTPRSVLGSAVGNVKYHCSIVFDGVGLDVRSANAQINRTSTGIYKGYESADGYYEYYLKRK